MRIWRVWIYLLPVIFGPSQASAWAVSEPAGIMTPASDAALGLAKWVRRADDNAGLPFVVIDKLAAEVLVFAGDGQLLGTTPALLGSAQGDDSVPGIGDRELATIRPEERTTPAGRFLAGFGRAAGSSEEFWVDYATAISLHPVVTQNLKEHRLQRLQTPSTDDNRITFGCINVDRSFFNATIRTTFNGTRGVVYILPEFRSIADVFPTFAAQAQSGTASGATIDANFSPS